MTEVVEQLRGSMLKMENFQKLLELKKDLIGIDNLVIPGRVGGGEAWPPTIYSIKRPY